MSENAIQREILDVLAQAGAFAIRVQSGRVQVRGGWMNLAPQGTPDILVLVPPRGLLLGLEVKTAKGEERESQLAWATAARRRGAVVVTVRSPEDALRAYLAALEASKKTDAAAGLPEATINVRNETSQVVRSRR